MKKQLNTEFIMDWWLQKYHNITIQWLIENEPELIKTPDWYKKYAVTQAEHDEWYDWAIDYMSKYYKMSKKTIKKNFAFDYLNCSPSIKKESTEE
jgi:hypothetical protein